MRKIFIISLFLSVIWATNGYAENKFKFTKVDGIVELFTSQGCSSCPPADAYMGEIKRTKPNHLVLTYAVTIWDYLGWKDNFATAKNTNRQRNYSNYLHLSSVYTPQSVVNGSIDVVGSDKHKITEHLAKSHLNNINIYMPMLITQDEMKVKISLPAASAELLALRKKFDATLWLVKYKDLANVSIAAGENSGRAIDYHNVVGDFVPLGMWEGEAREFTVSHRDLNGQVGDLATNQVAFILQLDGVGPIISAMKSK
ncbi:MAG: DUF1223 domain-containing protein [Rhizobiales bacterium]|nr:DUF1223 domain-containing protein [Hyphomicrobiales bacterium]NRB14593.1 DUF1223 domain-containing protein [Hyphomicrobiales bacterium]